MPEVAAEWEEALLAIASRQQKPTYMVSALLAAIKCIGEATVPNATELPMDSVLEWQTSLLERAGCSSINEAWKGAFHLSGTACVWTLLAGGTDSTFDHLARRKPRSIKQLSELANSVRFNGPLIKQISSSAGRASLAIRLCQHLIESDCGLYSDNQKLANLVVEQF
jgi:hypothetical protein